MRSSFDDVAARNAKALDDLRDLVKLFQGTPGLGALQQTLAVREELASWMMAVNGDVDIAEMSTRLSGLREMPGNIHRHAAALQRTFSQSPLMGDSAQTLFGDIAAHSTSLGMDLISANIAIEELRPTVSDMDTADSKVVDIDDQSPQEIQR